TAEMAESFQSLLNYGISLLQRFRIIFPLSSPKSTQRLQSLLRVLVQMCKMKAFKELCTPTPDLEEMVVQALKTGTAEWFYLKKQHLKPMVKTMEECGKALVSLLLEVNADLQDTMRLDLFSIAYLKMQELVSCYVKEQLSKIDSGMSQLTAESLFQLYLSMKDFYNMKDFVCSRDTPLALTGFHLWFKEAIPLWLQKTYTIALERTQRAIQVDQLTPLGELNKHSTSIVDLSTCYAQMVKTWQQLDWPDPEEAFMIMVKFVEISKSVTKPGTNISSGKSLKEIQFLIVSFSFFLQCSTMRLDLFSIAYLKMQELVSCYVKEQLSKIDSGMSQLTAESLFQLYLSMKDFYNMKDFVQQVLISAEDNTLPSKTYTIALERTQRAIQVDQLTPLGELNKHSTSIVDLSTCYAQMVKTWQQLDWPDPEEAFMIMVKFVEDMCKIALMYCQMIKARAEELSSSQTEAGQAANRLCVVVNNIEQLRMMILKLPKQLNWARLEQNTGPVITSEQIQHTLHQQLQASVSCLNNEIRGVVQTLATKMDARIAQHIQELSVCSDSDNPEDCITPLMRFLDHELQYLNMNLVQENFNSLLELLWNHTLDLLKNATKQEVGKLDYFRKFQFALQEEATPEKYGAVTIKAFYRHSEQKLYIEVLNAVNLLPMDSNGLSDPFIQLTLEPHHEFPEIATRTTECIKNNLHPLFDEAFEFMVPPEKCQQDGACLLLTVFDYDTLGANDLEGEAFLPLCKVLGLNEPEESINPSRVPQIRLSLTHPGTAGNDILKLLETRKRDKEAKAFVKLRKQRAKYSKELA
ncbi:hypothetical protein E2320_016379, partial [Naja naja]